MQLSGTVELDPAFSRPKAIRPLAAKLAKRPVGGGSLYLKELSSYPTDSSPLSGLGALLGLRSLPIRSPARGTPLQQSLVERVFTPTETCKSFNHIENAVDRSLPIRYRVDLPFELFVVGHCVNSS